MALRTLVQLVCLIVALSVGQGARAQDSVPQSRFVYSPDMDFPGGDLANLFDTTQGACERVSQFA